MAELFIRDKYFEKVLEDGTVVSMRTKYIVEALLYYQRQCYNILESNTKKIRATPKIIYAKSLESAMKEIEETKNLMLQNKKAETLIKKVNDILVQMSINPQDKQKVSDPDESQPNQ